MATCTSCGSELSGLYCNTCGARASEDRAPKKAKSAAPAKAAYAPGRSPGIFDKSRIWKTVTVGLLALIIYGAGIISGIYMNQGSTGVAGGTAPAAATGDAVLDSMPPLARANYYMEQGVALMNEGQRSAAVAEFRKSIKEWEAAIAAEPDNLYAQTYEGLTYYYAGDSAKALTKLRAVLEKDPNYLWAIFNLAWIYETADKKLEATMMYNKYIAVAEEEKKQQLKYAEQFELIDRQVEAAKTAVAKLNGGGTGK